MIVVYLLYLYQVFHILHGQLYFDGENEETIKRRCNPALSCFPSQLEWARLEENMFGRLVWPDDSLNYTVYNYQNNIWTVTYPIVHVVCESVEDIQSTVVFAKKHGLRVTIKSTGNEMWGKSSAHGSLSINLMEMKNMDVNLAATERNAHGEITVETGVTYGEIYKESKENIHKKEVGPYRGFGYYSLISDLKIWQKEPEENTIEIYGRIVFGLTNNGISPGGSIAGGGYGPLSPVFGLGVDNVLEIKVVLAHGRLAICTENKTVIENPDGTSGIRNNGDLFWALRGGGGGTFGVVVHYVLKLHLAPISIGEASISVSMFHNESDSELVKLFFEKFNEWERHAPYFWGGNAVLSSGRLSAKLKKYGPIDENTESELKPFYDLQTRYPQPSMITVSLVNHTRFIGGNSWRFGFYAAGVLLPPENHNQRLWEFLVQEVMGDSNGLVLCYLNRLGGKAAEYSVGSTSVHPSYRNAQSYLSCAFYASSYEGTSSWEVHEQHKVNVARFAEKFRKFGDQSNFYTSYIPSPDWKLGFWGAHYVDLLKVKIKYDPDNLFYCYHCVGSDRDLGGMYETSSAAANDTKLLLSVCLLLIATYMHQIFYEK